RNDHAQQLESLSGKIGRLTRQAGGIAARPRQTGDETGADWVPHRRGDDWDHRRRLLCCNGGGGSPRDNDVDLEPDELGSDLGSALRASLSPAIFDRDSATFSPAECAQPLQKTGGPLRLPRKRSRAQNSDGRHLARLLRTRRERPRSRRTAEQRYKVPPPHAGHGGSLQGAAADHISWNRRAQAVRRIRSLPSERSASPWRR